MPKTQNKNFDIDFNQEEFENSLERVMRTQHSFVETINDYQRSEETTGGVGQLEAEEFSYKAYHADSWAAQEEQKRDREAEQLPTGDVARFASIVDTISGSERQSRTDVQVFPFERDDQLTADAVNLYLKYRNRKESLWHEDSLVFLDAIISKRAHCEFFLRNNPNDGSLETVRVRRPSSEVFLMKPFKEIDGSDAKGLFHAQWIHLDDLKRRMKNKIDITLLDFSQPERKPTTEITRLLDAYSFPDTDNEDIFFKRSKNFVRVIRWWERKQKSIFRILNPAATTLDQVLVSTEDSKQKALKITVKFLTENPELIEQILQSNNIKTPNGNRISEATTRNIEIIANEIIEEQVKNVYFKHTISGRVELEPYHEWGDFLPWTHLFCYFADGRPGGLYERVKDLIIEINYIHNKLMERLGTLGKMPIGIEEGASPMSNDAIRDAFRDGAVIDFNKTAIRENMFHVFEDKTLGSIGPYITLEESLNRTMKELTGANDPLQGRSPGANTAGVAIDLLQRQGSTLLAPIQDNFKRFKSSNGKMEVKMLSRSHDLRPNWTSMKLARIVGGMISRTATLQKENLAQLIQERDELSPDNNEDAVVTLMHDILLRMKTMEYDFTVGEGLNSPTLRVALLQQLVQTAALAGFAIDPSVIIDESELPQSAKDKLIKFLETTAANQQLEGRGAQGGINSQGSQPNIAIPSSNGA